MTTAAATAAPVARPPIVASPAQARFLEAVCSGRYRFLAYGGAIGGGKTYALLLAFAMLCKVFPRSHWTIVRKDLPTMRRTVLPSYNRLRDQMGGFLGPVNQADWTATCANGSKLLFFTESLQEDPDLDRWKGLETNGFGLEEANELSEASNAKAIERAGRWLIPPTPEHPAPHQPPPLILYTFNPAPNWVRHTFYDPWKQGRLQAPFYFQPATVQDNPHLTAAYLENLKQMPAQAYARFVEGDWDAVAGRFFPEIHGDQHVIQRDTLPKELPHWWAAWAGYDWGFRHNASFGFYVQDGDGNQYCLDTLLMHGLHDHEQAERIATHAADHGLTRCLQAAYSGGDVFNVARAHGTALPVKVEEIFAQRGVLCIPAYTARIDGWRSVRQALTWTDAMPPRLRFVDTPGNRRKLETLLACEPDRNKDEDVQKFDADDQGRGGDDAADELRYALASRAHVTAPTAHVDHPWLTGVDPAHTLAALATRGDDADDARPWDDLPAGY